MVRVISAHPGVILVLIPYDVSYNCNKEGHLKRDCPEAVTSGGGGYGGAKTW